MMIRLLIFFWFAPINDFIIEPSRDCVEWQDDVELETNHVNWNNCGYHDAGEAFGVPWQILSSQHLIERGRQNYVPNCNAWNCCGPMQFKPSTFRHYQIDGNNDQYADIYAFHDSVYSAANLLSQNHHPDWNKCGEKWGQALFNYNHACWYVHKVMKEARLMGYTD